MPKTTKMQPNPLYVYRSVKNAKDILDWAKSQGISSTLDVADLHTTIIYSKQPIDWFTLGEAWQSELKISEGGPRTVEKFGDALVLRFACSELKWRNSEASEKGASYDFDEYKPHITLSYSFDGDVDAIEPYQGEIVLGPEMFEEIDEISVVGKILKSDDEQRVVYGWASVVTEKGEPVVDLQGDVIEPSELVRATTEFMKSARESKMMHQGGQIGTVIHSMPLIDDIAKSLGIATEREGWLVGVHVTDDDVWKRVKSGELAAFSIGGRAEKEAM